MSKETDDIDAWWATKKPAFDAAQKDALAKTGKHDSSMKLDDAPCRATITTYDDKRGMGYCIVLHQIVKDRPFVRSIDSGPKSYMTTEWHDIARPAGVKK